MKKQVDKMEYRTSRKILSGFLVFIICVTSMVTEASNSLDGHRGIDNGSISNGQAMQTYNYGFEPVDGSSMLSDSVNGIEDIPQELREEIYKTLVNERLHRSQQKGSKDERSNKKLLKLIVLSEKINKLEDDIKKLKLKKDLLKENMNNAIKKSVVLGSIGIALFLIKLALKGYAAPAFLSVQIAGYLAKIYNFVWVSALSYPFWTGVDVVSFGDQYWDASKKLDYFERDLNSDKIEFQKILKNKNLYDDFLSDDRELDDFIVWLKNLKAKNNAMIQQIRELQTKQNIP